MSCGVGRRHSLGLALLELWRRLAAEALIGPRTWELPCAVKKKKKQKKKKISVYLGLQGGCYILQ